MHDKHDMHDVLTIIQHIMEMPFHQLYLAFQTVSASDAATSTVLLPATSHQLYSAC